MELIERASGNLHETTIGGAVNTTPDGYRNSRFRLSKLEGEEEPGSRNKDSVHQIDYLHTKSLNFPNHGEGAMRIS